MKHTEHCLLYIIGIIMTTTAVFNPDSEGTFPLSKIAFFNASLNKLNWINMSLKKEISSFGFRYVFFNTRQLKAILELIPKVDDVLKNTDPETEVESVEIPTAKGDKRIVVFTHKTRFYVEICTFAKPQTKTAVNSAKRPKCEEEQMVKVSH